MAQKKKNSKKGVSAAKTRGAANTKKSELAENARRQATAVLLFAGAILLMCLAVIRGGSLWGWLHNTLLGLFGWCAFLVPVLLGYIAVNLALEKATDNARTKLWQTVTLMVMFSGMVQVFRQNTADVTFWQAVQEAFRDGAQYRGTGVVGTLPGYALEYLFTDLGAKIILVLLVFVFIMLVTGTSVITLFKMLWTPVRKTKESLETAMESQAQQRKQRATIDVALDDENESAPAIEENDDKLAAFEKVAAEMAAEEQNLPDVADLLDTPTEQATPDEPVVVAPEGEQLVEEEQPEEEAEPVEEYRFPPLSLLNESKAHNDSAAAREQTTTAELLTKTLSEFGVSAKVIDVSHGPTVTRYELQPSAGVKISRITGLADDIALRLATTGVRIEAPIPNKAAVGIEVPNKVSGSVCLRDLIDTREFEEAQGKLTVALGKDIGGQIVLADLAKMPHLLIAGTTGSGKSVCTNSMIQSILFRARPDEVRLLLIDPKQVEFGIYNGIPHLLVPVVTDPRKAAGALGWAVNEMLRRYKMFAEKNVREIFAYNEAIQGDDTLERLPQIVIVIDELSDLMMVAANEVESNICRLAQMARAAGMHLVIATQRPSVDVITGLIKANIPSRLALTVASAVDSRTILDTGGAEKLLGKGDMLFMPVGFAKPVRVQGCFVGNREVEAVVDFLKSTESQQYDEAVEQEIIRQAQAAEKSGSRGVSEDDDAHDSGDEMLPQAIEVVVEAGMASTSLLQRRLRLGYARAGRIIDEMEQRGIVGPHEGSKPRQVLITRQQWLEMNMTRPDDDVE